VTAVTNPVRWVTGQLPEKAGNRPCGYYEPLVREGRFSGLTTMQMIDSPESLMSQVSKCCSLA